MEATEPKAAVSMEATEPRFAVNRETTEPRVAANRESHIGTVASMFTAILYQGNSDDMSNRLWSF
jgi:hypothetical protein